MDTDSATFDRLRSAGYLTNHLARLFAHRLAEALAPLELAPAQFMTLLPLWEKDGLTQAELSRLLDVEQATMANTLSRMERDGLIARRRSETDARARTIHLTDHARALRDPAQATAGRVNRQALGPMEAEDQARFLADLRAMIDRLSR